MTTKQEPDELAFTASEFITILMALEASMMFAKSIGNAEEYIAARDLRHKLATVVAARMVAYEKTDEKTDEKVH